MQGSQDRVEFEVREGEEGEETGETTGLLCFESARSAKRSRRKGGNFKRQPSG